MDEEMQKQIGASIDQQKQEMLSNLAGVPAKEASPFNDKTISVPSPDLNIKPLEKGETVAHRTSEKAMEIIGEEHQAAVIGVSGEQEVKEKIQKHARDAIDTGLKTIDNDMATDAQRAYFDRHKEALADWNVISATEMWKMRVMVALDAIWSVIWFIFGFFTINPMAKFSRGLKKFLGDAWWVTLLAVLIIVGIYGWPLILWLIDYLKNKVGIGGS